MAWHVRAYRKGDSKITKGRSQDRPFFILVQFLLVRCFSRFLASLRRCVGDGVRRRRGRIQDWGFV